METRHVHARAALLTLMLWMSAHELIHAQQTRGTRGSAVSGLRVDQVARIDGKLDETFWRLARPAGPFRQVEPVEGNAPSKPTDVRLVFTEDAVLVGARLEDDAHVLKEALEKAVAVDGSLPDYFEVQIDPHPDHQTIFDFVVTVHGERRVTLMTAKGATIDSWTMDWESAMSVDENGWTIEMRIPLSEMHVEKGTESWGIGLKRFSWKRLEMDVLDGRRPVRIAIRDSAAK